MCNLQAFTENSTSAYKLKTQQFLEQSENYQINQINHCVHLTILNSLYAKANLESNLPPNISSSPRYLLHLNPKEDGRGTKEEEAASREERRIFPASKESTVEASSGSRGCVAATVLDAVPLGAC